MTPPKSERGQLVMPMIALLFLFGMLWVVFVLWCRDVYWKMRMDMAADCVALSAAREEACLLNDLGTVQELENPFLQKLGVGKGDYGVLEVSNRRSFESLNTLLVQTDRLFVPSVSAVAQAVAQANGANRPAVPLAAIDPLLAPHSVLVLYLAKFIPVGFRRYASAFYTRKWSPRTSKPQPPHRSEWAVCHNAICGDGAARLWLDVEPSSFLCNGGFPSADGSMWRRAGIQCFYPQFSAQRIHKR